MIAECGMSDLCIRILIGCSEIRLTLKYSKKV